MGWLFSFDKIVISAIGWIKWALGGAATGGTAIYAGHKNETILALLLGLSILGADTRYEMVLAVLTPMLALYTGYKIGNAVK